MTWEACGKSLRLDAGTHDISVASTDQFAPATLVLEPKLGAAGSPTRAGHDAVSRHPDMDLDAPHRGDRTG